MILYINACVREDSRTEKLAKELLSHMNGEVQEVKLSEVEFAVTDAAYLAHRDQLIAEEKYDDPMFGLARQFAAAEEIVIAAPYWDLSFPASLKQYIEKINVSGITFRYTPEGYPEGLCSAKKLWYVQTAGGSFLPQEYGYGYICTLAKNFYGIPECALITASGFDVDGADEEALFTEGMEKIREMWGQHD